MKLAELLKPWQIDVANDCDIKGLLTNDSRKVAKGDLFFAYAGTVADGRRYIPQALAAGAKAVLYDPLNWPMDIPFPDPANAVAVADLAKQLAAIASRFYQEPTKKLNVTGVTGTNGKTTIAYQLAQAHSLLANPAAYIGTLGQGQPFSLQELANTTPDGLCLQQLFHHYEQNGMKQVCMEVSSHALAQQRVDCIEFKQALFTNLTLDHLDYHKTMAEYAAAKAKLFAWPSLEFAITNQDDSYAGLMQAQVPASCQQLTYGIESECDVRAMKWQVGMNGTRIELSTPWGNQQIQISALGFFNIYNALALFSSLMATGYDVDRVVKVMSQLKPAPGRMEQVAESPCIIVDYAHTPDALQNALATLGKVKQNRLITVFGCGGDRDKSKRPIMGKIATDYADIAIMTSDNPRSEDPLQIMNDIAQGIDKTRSLYKIADRMQAIAKAIEIAEPDDIILIAGKGHEAYQQIGQIKYPFSDQEVARRLLSERVKQ